MILTCIIADISKNRPELQRVPLHPNFALQLILEVYEKLTKGETWGFPLSNENANEIISEHPAKEELEELLSILKGEIKVLNEEDFQDFIKQYSETDDAVYEQRPVSGFTQRGNTGTLEIKPAPELFIKKAEEIISKVEAPIGKSGSYTNGYTIRVNNPSIIFHIHPDMKWESSKFDLQTQISSMDNNRMHRV